MDKQSEVMRQLRSSHQRQQLRYEVPRATLARIAAFLDKDEIEFDTTSLQIDGGGVDGTVSVFTADVLIHARITARTTTASTSEVVVVSRRALQSLTLPDDDQGALEHRAWIDQTGSPYGWGDGVQVEARYDGLGGVLLPSPDLVADSYHDWVEFLPSLRGDLSR